MNLRLRVAWGGGEARQWQGSLSAEHGSFSRLDYLGLDANESATIYLDNNTVHVEQRADRDYDGFDIQVSGSRQTVLELALAPSNTPEDKHEIDVPLEELITGYRHVTLDDRGNQILIQRVSGDRLRTKFDRSSLVFSPGESFEFEVEPHETGLTDQFSLQCHVELFGDDDQEPLWDQRKALTWESEGGFESIGPITVPLPDSEGVYRVVISVFRKRFRNTFMQPAPLLQREIQLVVVADEAPERMGSSNTPWELIDTITPNHASWMEWLSKVPKLPLLPDFQQEPLGNNESTIGQHLGQELVELAPKGWQAYPTSTRGTGKPHIVEVEYPSDVPQTLGISIVETNAVGQVVPLGLDSGVDVTRDAATEPPRMLRHRLIFWPRTSTPLVLLTNQRNNQPAIFGKIRVYAGPDSLPLPDDPESEPMEDPRLLAAYFDQPFFPENFSSPEAADSWSGRSLKDWGTFYEGGKRLVEYLKHVGYNGAVISVASQGGTIYPSRCLKSNPQYDTGTFFASGQDPVQKDVLEMLFRLFDRANLTLIPSVHFSSTLEGLERQLRANPAEARGIALVDRQGKAWREGYETKRGMGPHYNPLDKRVQTAMHRVLNEITDRYGEHRSFGGLGLQLSPDTYSLLPGEHWGNDEVTWQRFQQDHDISVSGRKSREDAFRSRDDQRAWLHWRASLLARFHQEMLESLQTKRDDARLYLLGGDIFTNPLVQPMLRPTIPNRLRVDEALLQMGIAAENYAEQNEIVFFRPQRTAPRRPLAQQAININLATNRAADQAFSEFDPAASLFYHERRVLPLPSFNAQSPFGQDNTHTVLYRQATPSAVCNRQRFVHHLALRDVRYFADGGRMLPMGQEDSVRNLFKTLSQLPARKFNTVTPQTTTWPTQPLVVRTLAHQGKTYLYVVNDSPWHVTAEIDIQAPKRCELEPLGQRQATQSSWYEDQMTWGLDLEPFDVAAATLSTDQAAVETWRVSVDRDTYASLRRKVEELKGRVLRLQQPNPLNTLTNPSFEASPQRPTGWIAATKKGVAIEVDTETAFEGEQSLKIASQGPVAWIRSDPFDPPKTGRVAVVVRLRVDDPENQPPLRLAIDGKFLDESSYYVPFNVGRNSNVKPIGDDWGDKPYVLLISDLPTNELVNIRVGFDLMGAGQVWIDDVHVYDRWFPKHEQDDLMIMRGLAARSLSKGHLADCRRILNGYWSQFLMQHISAQTARMAKAPPATPGGGGGGSFPPPQPEEGAEKPSMLDKVKKRLPTKVFPFRLR